MRNSELYLNFEDSDTGRGMYHLHYDSVDFSQPLLYLCGIEASDIPAFRKIDHSSLSSKYGSNSGFLMCPECLKNIR